MESTADRGGLSDRTERPMRDFTPFFFPKRTSDVTAKVLTERGEREMRGIRGMRDEKEQSQLSLHTAFLLFFL